MTSQRLAHSIALLAAAAAGLSAIGVLIGWHVASPAMVGLGMSPVAMHYNTALAVLFSALSLLCYRTNHLLVARLLAIPTLQRETFPRIEPRRIGLGPVKFGLGPARPARRPQPQDGKEREQARQKERQARDLDARRDGKQAVQEGCDIANHGPTIAGNP